jgi:acetyl esterase
MEFGLRHLIDDDLIAHVEESRRSTKPRGNDNNLTYADEYFIQAYVGHVSDRTNPDISPLFADLSHALDILLEDNLAMAARLSSAGGGVDLRVFPESPHGFTSHPTSMATVAWRAIESWVAENLT